MDTFDAMADLALTLPHPSGGIWECASEVLTYGGNEFLRVGGGRQLTVDEATVLCGILNGNHMRPVR